MSAFLVLFSTYVLTIFLSTTLYLHQTRLSRREHNYYVPTAGDAVYGAPDRNRKTVCVSSFSGFIASLVLTPIMFFVYENITAGIVAGLFGFVFCILATYIFVFADIDTDRWTKLGVLQEDNSIVMASGWVLPRYGTSASHAIAPPEIIVVNQPADTTIYDQPVTIIPTVPDTIDIVVEDSNINATQSSYEDGW